MKRPYRKRVQAAVEYLTTYSWALLIIATVLAVLILIGFFNPGFFTPKAPPGSCSVYRPQGPGSTYLIALTGACGSELPQYVTNFKNNNNYMDVGSFSAHVVKSSMSLALWAYVLNPVPSEWYSMGGMTNSKTGWAGDVGFYIVGQPPLNSPQCVFENSAGQTFSATLAVTIPTNRWHYFVATYDGSTLKCYMDNQLIASNGASGYITNTMEDLTFGFVDGLINQYLPNGDVANIQFYNSSLSANEVTALYRQGIGSPPIDLQHLVGWWPLNGNLNDYSGNGYNGNFFGNTQNIGLSYVTNWQNGYSNT